MPSEPLKQSFLYKDGKAELFNDIEVEAKLADGWYDNPAASMKPKPTPFVDPSSAGDGLAGPTDPMDHSNSDHADMAAGSAPKRGPGRPRKNAA